jgi:phenylpyruvate tautomerase PptA (4-oxalocrotonate tautomerase family)
MPFVRISLKRGKSAEFRNNIAKSVHQALVSSFGIPENDMFQLIEELNEENIIYPQSYMGINHTSEIIYISITAKAGRTIDMKKLLYKTIAQNIFAATQHNKEDIIITLVENSEANWSFGNGEAQLID